MKPQGSRNNRRVVHASKKTDVKPQKTDPTIQNAFSALLNEQLLNMLGQPNTVTQNSRPRLPSKRRMSESDESDDDDAVEGASAPPAKTPAKTPVHPASKKAKERDSSSAPKPKPTEYASQVVLLDGVHESLKTNPKKFIDALKTLKPEVEIKSVRKTASGAMLIHPKHPKDCNSLLKEGSFPQNSILGKDVKARLPKSQTVTHQVIIKNIDSEVTEDEVKDALNRQELPFTDVKRIWSRQRDGPSNMMRLILKDENKKKQLLKNGVYLDQMVFKCVPAKEDTDKKLVFQCWNCQQWNDHKTFDCKKETKCVICSGPHRKSDCPKQKDDALCTNCDGKHAAWSTECPIYQAEVEKKKTFSNITVAKTPSIIEDTVQKSIQQVLSNLLQALKKQMAIMMAEVVAKAFLEHIFYESESRKTNGEKHLGATARVHSIVKTATESVNSTPFMEADIHQVDMTDVKGEVMKRLQSSMSVTAKAQTPGNAATNSRASISSQ